MKNHPIIATIALLLLLLGLAVWITGGFRTEIFGAPLILERPNHPFAYMFMILMIGVLFTRDHLALDTFRRKTRSVRLLTFEIALLVLIIIFEIGHFIAYDYSSFWNMDSERDLATYYHTALLFFNGMLIFTIYLSEKRNTGKSEFGWLPILALFWGLTIDELVGFHNGIPRYLESLGLIESGGDSTIPLWPIFLAPLAIAVVIYLAIFFWKRFRGKRRLLVAFLVAMGIWGLAYGAEMLLATSMKHRTQVGLEEGAELLGTSLMAIVFMLFSREHVPNSEE